MAFTLLNFDSKLETRRQFFVLIQSEPLNPRVRPRLIVALHVQVCNPHCPIKLKGEASHLASHHNTALPFPPRKQHNQSKENKIEVREGDPSL